MANNSILSKRYSGYPEAPYISPERDLAAWEADPAQFYYGVVERKQMQRLPEGVLPGHIVMLWRIHFGSFTNETVIPQYFEYRYGVDSKEALETLTKLDFIAACSATDSLDCLTIPQLKKLLAASGLPAKGNKAQLLAQLKEQLPEDKLAPLFPLRRYQITTKGTRLLEKYDDIIRRHGPKDL